MFLKGMKRQKEPLDCCALCGTREIPPIGSGIYVGGTGWVCQKCHEAVQKATGTVEGRFIKKP